MSKKDVEQEMKYFTKLDGIIVRSVEDMDVARKFLKYQKWESEDEREFVSGFINSMWRFGHDIDNLDKYVERKEESARRRRYALYMKILDTIGKLGDRAKVFQHWATKIATTTKVTRTAQADHTSSAASATVWSG